MLKLTLSLVLLCSVALVLGRTEKEYQTAFIQFMKQYDRTYSHDEFPVRYRIFKDNVARIDTYNERDTGVVLAINKFADLTKAEFKRFYLGLKVQEDKREPVYQEDLNMIDLPTSVDWRTKNAVTPIKNQGDCGSCWAFSTTGSLEGLHAIKDGSLLSFSEQQLVDCSGSFGNEGCDGGLMDDAFKYVAEEGIETESDYPYTGEDDNCNYTAKAAVFKNTGYFDVPVNSSSSLAAAAAQQPVSVAVEADQDCFQYYSSGILSDPTCGTNLDHGVLVVGYDTDSSGNPYWIVKNSWGADWGNNGYLWIQKQTTAGPGECGIAMSASYPTLSAFDLQY